MEKLQVVHIKQNGYLAPSETFVHARVLNPVCQRLIHVITDEVNPSYIHAGEIRFHETASLRKLLRRFILAISYRLHWNAYYFEILRRLRPQLIHAHFSGAGEDCLWSAKWLKIPLLINFYGIETNYHIHDPAWLLRYQRIYAMADGLICSSDHMRSEMIASGCPAEKISVVRCGIDLELFSSEPTELKKNDTLRLLSIARLHPEKGLAYLLRACKLLTDENLTDWELKIIGVGPLFDELTGLTRELGLEKQVLFMGKQSPQQVAAELHLAHLTILPSLKESQGIVLAESQAACTPVIASNVGGIPESLINGETGFLVEPESSQAIFEKIRYFIQNPQELPRMGRAGRDFVEKKFSREVEYTRLADIYKNHIENKANKGK